MSAQLPLPEKSEDTEDEKPSVTLKLDSWEKEISTGTVLKNMHLYLEIRLWEKEIYRWISVIKHHTFIWTSDPYANIAQYTEMMACHSTHVPKNLTAHQQLPAKRITLNKQNKCGVQ